MSLQLNIIVHWWILQELKKNIRHFTGQIFPILWWGPVSIKEMSTSGNSWDNALLPIVLFFNQVYFFCWSSNFVDKFSSIFLFFLCNANQISYFLQPLQTLKQSYFILFLFLRWLSSVFRYLHKPSTKWKVVHLISLCFVQFKSWGACG